ncbi:MAG TPA: hypothetical protein VM529_26750, partial [Gemmata sp.]|nr:hypothetical protein [Gemmata sp.]
DVQRYLDGEPVQAVPPTAGYRLRKWARRNRVAVVTVGIIWLVTLAQVGFSTVQWWKADTARAAEVRERRKADAARVEAEEHRTQAEAQRTLAEYRAAAVTVDAALEALGRTDTREGLVRLVGTLKMLPPDATALRQGVVTNLLVWGQHIAPASRSITNSLHAVSPDGRVGLIAPNGVWEARDLVAGKLLARLGGEDATTGGPFPADWGRSATFSADGRVVATLHTPESAAGPTVRVWDAATWKERFRLRPAKLTYEVRLNRAGSRLATRSDTASLERTNDPDKLRTVVHLWDAQTGDKMATLDHGAKPVEQLDFTPDGSVLATVSGRVVRLWSAADGRLLHTLDKHAVSVDLVAFSPSGKTLAVAAGPRVHWWNVAGGTPAGPSVGLGFAPSPADLDEVIRFGFETEDVLVVRVWNRHGVTFGRRTGGAVCVRGEVKPYVLDAICSDGRHVLTEDRHVYSLSPLRRLNPPPGREFPPEVLAASGGRRYIQVGTEFLDLVAEVRVGGELNRPETRVHPVRAAGFGFAIGGDWSYGRFSGPVLVPAPTVLPPDDVLELWARVLARGRVDPDSGLFQPDDEATWERNRRELVGRAEPAGEFPFPGAFASDPLFWLRRAYKEAEKMEDKLPLVERLVAAEPSWQNYLHRAYVYSYTGRGPDAIRDDLRARELAKGEFEPDADERANGAPGAVYDIIRKADRPGAEYELALRWLDATGADEVNLRALALYRLGRAGEALRALAALEVPRATDVAGALMSPWAALAVGRAHAEALGREWRGNATVPLLIEALCHEKLGRTDAARRCLAVARELLRERDEDAELRRGNYGYESVADEAVRAVQPKE